MIRKFNEFYNQPDQLKNILPSYQEYNQTISKIVTPYTIQQVRG